MRVADFEAYLRAKSGLVDDALQASLERDGIPNLHDGVLYALGLDVPDRAKRGKRIRPSLCLMVAESLGAEDRRAMPFALACEVLHNFFLVHDDIEDGDVKRRGRDTVWVRFGRDNAINIGDYMFTLTYRSVLRSSEAGVDGATLLRLVELMTATLEHTGEGQALDMNARRRRDLTMEDYLRIVEEKTGSYLACALIGGALVAGADAAVVAALERFGRMAMPVFQIADDMLDLSEAKGRGEVGSDIKEGKRSFLVVHTAAHCTPAEGRGMFDILDKPREETTAEDVERVIRLFRKYGAEEAGRRRGEELLGRAREAIKPLPPDLRQNLDLAAHYLLERRA